jgi:hypothetical protein
MSDAIACWYLGHPARRARLVRALTDRDAWSLGDLMDGERGSGRLRNDDVAILLVGLKG